MNNTENKSTSLAKLEDEITTLAAHINAATHRLLCCIREFDEQEGWREQGFVSCAHWLNWKVGLDLGAAREKVRVARAMTDLPQISETLRRGEMSYSKIRALSRIADAENEADLLDIAQHATASQVEKLVRVYRRADPENKNDGLSQHEARRLNTFYDEDGMLVIQGRLDPAAGALVIQALNAASDALCKNQAKPTEQTPTAEQDCADALALMAEQALAAGFDERSDANERYQVVVHVDKENLEKSDRCHLEDGPRVSAETSRRLACDADIVEVTHQEDGSLEAGRKTRRVNKRLARALRARDEGCQFPGCSHRRFVDAHHVNHWADGGSTELENLLLLCRRHHVIVHEGGYGISRQNGRWVFLKPGGDVFPSAYQLPSVDGDVLEQLEARHSEDGIKITPETGLSHWKGERMDYEWAVEVL